MLKWISCFHQIEQFFKFCWVIEEFLEHLVRFNKINWYFKVSKGNITENILNWLQCYWGNWFEMIILNLQVSDIKSVALEFFEDLVLWLKILLSWTSPLLIKSYVPSLSTLFYKKEKKSSWEHPRRLNFVSLLHCECTNVANAFMLFYAMLFLV